MTSPLVSGSENGGGAEAIKRKYKMQLTVGKVTLTLVRQQAAMARVMLGNMSARIDMLHSHRQILGRLGSVAITDLTPAGAHFREVFSTTGCDMLDFEIKEVTGLAGAGNVVAVRVAMSSVRCIYTRRFFAELSAYISQFQETRNIIARMREAAAGMIASMKSQTHVELDIRIDRPLVIIPRNSFSDTVLEADLGLTIVTNELKVRTVYIHWK